MSRDRLKEAIGNGPRGKLRKLIEMRLDTMLKSAQRGDFSSAEIMHMLAQTLCMLDEMDVKERRNDVK